MEDTIEITIGKLKFDCRIAGKEDKELVIFLHGFPESSYMWKGLMNHLAAVGFYCLAPNLRGYSKDACPRNKRHYSLNMLSNDILEIAASFGRSKFHLIGHDWGAAIGWKVVHDHRDAISSWTGISVPHLQAFGEAIVNDPVQRKMSKYIRTFQWPFLPEIQIRKNDFALFRKLWKHHNSDEIDAYLKIFRNRKQLSAAITYYRSNYSLLKKAAHGKIFGDINVPTLFIWGNKDPAIGSEAVKNHHQFMKNEYEFLELDAGHWLIQTKYKELKNNIRDHLCKYKNSN